MILFPSSARGRGTTGGCFDFCPSVLLYTETFG